MCSYASVNGVPSCASGLLLNTLVRKEWGRPDSVIVTDCEVGARADFDGNGDGSVF